LTSAQPSAPAHLSLLRLVHDAAAAVCQLSQRALVNHDATSACQLLLLLRYGDVWFVNCSAYAGTDCHVSCA
jgi:hypothetical protein